MTSSKIGGALTTSRFSWSLLVVIFAIAPFTLFQAKLSTAYFHFQNEIYTAASTVCNCELPPTRDLHNNEEEAEASVQKKPLNVLIFYPDDMRHDSISAAGTQLVQTPFLDSLAQDGIRFPYNSVTTAICWISRATLFTGQYLSRHQSHPLQKTMFYNPDRWNETWPYLLQKERAYFVGHIGKWQYRDDKGFVQSVFNWTRLFEGLHWHTVNKKRVHTSDYTQDSTIDFLRERPKDRPFAVTVAFYPPKGINGNFSYWNPKEESMKLYSNVSIPEPFDAEAAWNRLPRTVFTEKNVGRETWYYSFGTPERFQHNMKNMYRMITEVDTACKNVVEELKRQGILNETMVIFTTDNGMLHGEHGLGGKWFPYTESIRVPLIIWDPRMPASKRGTLDDSYTLNIDLAPTILGAAQIDPPLGMQGRNIADLYLKKYGSQNWRQEFYYEHPTHMGENKIPKSSALVRKDFKYLKYDNLGVESLFHLASDPMELNDVINNTVFQTKLVEMRKRYQELKVEVEKLPPYSGIIV